MEANYMTRKAWDALNKKLLQLQNDVKPGGKMAKEIGKAASHGDLSENAEWEAAILKKDMIGNEINNIRHRLSNVTIIDEMEITTEKVMLGTIVTVYDLDNDKELVYQILSSDDAPFYENVISAKSPVARGFLGKREGDEMLINVPAGDRNFEIVKIERFS